MIRESSDYIIERLTQEKVTKEYVKGNRKLLENFTDYLFSALNVYKSIDNGDLSYHAVPDIFLDVKPLYSSKPRRIMCKVFIDWDKSLISMRSVKGFNGLLVGLDFNKFDKKSSFVFDGSFGLNRFFNRRIGRYILNHILLSDVKDIAAVLRACNGHLDRREAILNFLNKYKFNLSYINQVYHNDLEEFFLDGIVCNKYVHRDLNWPDRLDVPEKAGFAEDFFMGPYGKTFCDKVYNDIVSNFYRDFDSFKLQNGCFDFFSNRTFAPWVLVSFDKSVIDGNNRNTSSGFYYYSLPGAGSLSSFSKVYTGMGSKNYLGFFNGMITLDKDVGNPFDNVSPVCKSDVSSISWD